MGLFINSDTPHYENVPFEVPESWAWTTIEEICSKIGSGSTPRGSNYSANGIPFFRSQNVYNDRLVYDDIKYISEEVHQKMKGTEVLANDLLLNITGGSLGRCAVVPADFNYGNVSQHVCIMRSVLVEPEYFHALVLSSYFAKSMKITGSGREGLPKYSLEQMAFPLPPLSEQQRIVMEIEKLFALIDQIEHSKVNLQTIIKQAKSKILDLAIHGKLVPQDSNDEPAIKLLKRINPDFTPCDNGHYPFEIPNVWQWCTINDISQVITGSTPSKNNIEYYGGNFPFYKPTDLDTGRHVMKASEYLTEKGKSVSRIIPPKSIAICCIGSIGKTGYIEVEGTTNQQINTIVPKRNLLNSVYGYYTCISDYFVNKLINSSSAITISIINKSKLQSVMFPLPPLTEQQRIVQKIEELFSVLDNIQKALEV